MITEESLSLELDDPSIVRVRYVQITNGIDLGSTLVLDRANLTFVADQLEGACEGDYRAIAQQAGPDHLRVYGSGSDQEPIVNVLCRRDPAGPHGGLSGLMLTLGSAKALAAQLRAAASGSPSHAPRL